VIERKPDLVVRSISLARSPLQLVQVSPRAVQITVAPEKALD
jgi:hypothetical protein